MPTDYSNRLDDAEVQALAGFVTTVSGGEAENAGGGGGTGRARGCSGGD